MDCIYLFSPLIDIVVSLTEEFPINAGETKSVDRVMMSAGGGANTLFAARRIGLEIVPFGTVGGDSGGWMVLEDYRREGIDTAYLSVRADTETPYVVVLVDATGKHAFVSDLRCDLSDLTRLNEAVASAKAVIGSGYQMVSEKARRAMSSYFQLARSMGKKTFFDPGPMIPRIPSACLDEMLRLTDVLFVNEEEAALLTGPQDFQKTAAQLSAVVKKQVVVKLGAEGCYVREHNGTGTLCPGFPVKLVDTTGAGDSFLAAYILGDLAGWDLVSTALFANAMGAAKAAKRGCGTQVPTLLETLEVLRGGGYAVDADTILHRKQLKLPI